MPASDLRQAFCGQNDNKTAGFLSKDSKLFFGETL